MTTIYCKYRAVDGFEIYGCPDALENLVRVLCDATSMEFDTPPTIDDDVENIVSVQVIRTAGPAELSRREETLLITGSDEARKILAHNATFDVQFCRQTLERHHNHLEYFQGLEYLSPSSEPLIVVCDPNLSSNGTDGALPS